MKINAIRAEDNWTGNMDFELDIDYRFTGRTDSFEIANKDGTGCIFYELVKKALMRSKRDHIGNELPEIAVDYLADEIADDMYNNTFQDMLYQMILRKLLRTKTKIFLIMIQSKFVCYESFDEEETLIEEAIEDQDKDIFNYDTE
eukprot:scaffold246333_cov51-Attheya_sp.AAC.1